ncbi:propanol-preferring alcohol dehydrogenase [Crenobacter luteus]|uniref:zinc-dependent alcohol dehydrogenase family protein n=1 Tax=Crenobacter luteus TaxID=1452487 RepID=UPI001048286E|nr:zinc-dependent alcohol dehydrogenase family protein [Crenobacter luteus]TCP11358.1 propanol-preferring alcohol dehydrogenase [Crenobacter luteus]
MRAMQSQAPGEPLVLVELPVPSPGPGQLLIRVAACGVCRTDLHVVDGELPATRYPVIPGHEIVGTVAGIGPDCAGFALGQRVGVPWLAHTCGGCAFCRAGRENLCDAARFTGYTVDGGYAEYAVADARFCLALPAGYDDLAVAPLLCAGLIGYRALRLAGDARRLGLYGFGAAAHIVAQVARAEGRAVYAFTRPLDAAAQAFAREMGAAWAGGSDAPPPEPLDAALIFASVGALVPAALAAVERGGTVVCAGIHMSDIPSFPYALLWGERTLRSVANLTRADGAAFMSLAARVPITTRVVPYPLEDANAALAELRDGRIEGAAVLRIAG